MSESHVNSCAHELPVSDAPLTPLSFLERSASVWAQRPAVVDGARAWTYRELHDRVRRGAAALRADLQVASGERVALLLPNVAAMLEMHYAVPAAGAVLVPLNTRLAAADYAHVLEHSGARVIIAGEQQEDVLTAALDRVPGPPLRTVWVSEDPDRCEYEQMLQRSAPVQLQRLTDERAPLAISYTSGTTGLPKGVVSSHRGAYLHSLGIVAEAALTTSSGYLWTLPMFHCNGWAFTWAVTAMGATHICLPRVDPEAIWMAIHGGAVTHLCAAPTVLSMMLSSDLAAPAPAPVRAFVGGAPPAPALLEKIAALNIQVTHLYGLTETYGPLAVCAWNPDWDVLSRDEQHRLRARQGVGTIVTEALRVVDEQMRDVPADGQTLGEVVMRGNNVMLGYYREPEATRESFRGGWFHSGDLAVMHLDGYIELRDRLKDIVISGGENIATIEVEQTLAAHPLVCEAAVVGVADERWGEVPVAFVTVRPGARLEPAALEGFARERLARFKVPKRIEIVGELPRGGTGKIQKFILRRWAITDRRRDGDGTENT